MNYLSTVKKKLKELGSKVNANNLGAMLWDAALHNSEDVCKLLLNKPQLKQQYGFISKAFDNACRNNSLSVVKLFINEMHVNELKLKEALDTSSKFGSSDVVEFLIEKMELTNASENQVWRLIAECALNNVGVIEKNIHLVEGRVISDMLEAACNKGSLSVIQWLQYNKPAEFNLCIDQLLITASLNGHRKVIKFLLENSNDTLTLLNEFNGKCEDTILHLVIWKDSNDWTPLHAACDKGDKKEVDNILVYDKSYLLLNSQNNYGRTPLHQACLRGNSEIVDTLLVSGADTRITNDFGDTPREQAIHNGNAQNTVLLRILNMELFIKNKKFKNFAVKKSSRQKRKRTATY